eukprot:5951798-Prymnesium_polylepis.1
MQLRLTPTVKLVRAQRGTWSTNIRTVRYEDTRTRKQTQANGGTWSTNIRTVRGHTRANGGC